MRKVKLVMQMTINGFVGGPDGEGDWMTWNPDPEFSQFLQWQYDASGTLLLGRKLGEGFIDYWGKTAAEDPDHFLAGRITAIPKIIFSKTLKATDRPRTTVENRDLAKVIHELKQGEGKDILIIGGAGFAASMIKAQMIDEYHLIVNPTAMGNGMTIFGTLDGIRRFTPIGAKLYSGGKVVLSYKPKND